MRIHLKPVVSSLLLVGALITFPAVAADKQTAVKKHKPHHVKQTRVKSSSATQTNETSNHTESDDDHPNLSKKELNSLVNSEREYLPFDLDVPGQAFVSTGPYIGVPLQYAGSNLIVNSPNYYNDVVLLNIRKSIMEQLRVMGGEITKEPYHSHLLLSGLVEGQANYTHQNGQLSTSSLDMTNVSLDAFFLGPSEWTLGFVEFSYDNNPPNASPYVSTSSYTAYNSRVYVNKAFITIGDFVKSPFFTTFGQFYVPFGAYSNIMVTSTMPTTLMRTKARSIELGYRGLGKNLAYATTYVFKGDSHVGSTSRMNNGGIDLGVIAGAEKFHGRVGVGAIANMSDSAGMQIGTGLQTSEQLTHRVPAYNFHANLNIGDHIDIITEWVGASTRYNPNDMSFNTHGAQPWALDTQASYSFYAFEKPSSVGIGYDKSHEALAVGLPLARYSAVFNTSIWRNTLQSLEFRHDISYASSNTANGPTAGVPVGTCTAVACSMTGRSLNSVTAQFDYYF